MTTTPGLRERKKQRTRAAIQTQALRLFAERGYDATTIEQIAEAADISPSTFFRYFPTKEDVVIEDDYDPLIIEAFRTGGGTGHPLATVRAAMREVFDGFDAEEERKILERTQLIFGVPALRARTTQSMFATIEIIAAALAETSGRDPADRELQIFAGACIGAWIAVLLAWAASGGEERLADVMDAALAQLETGFDGPLTPKPGP
jgi:AcrR family transcriptional regulator